MCKAGKCLHFAVLLLIGILCTGCGGISDANSTPTITQMQASALGEHTRNPHIRGTITKISTSEGHISGFSVEGVIESDTEYDKASVGITETTRIYMRTDTGYEVSAFDQLAVGVKVEVLFTGIIMERYPVQGRADEIMIIP
jgi:hypothetical protein